MKDHNKTNLYDLIIIGGGIGGLITLRYALKAKLKVLLLERKKQLGGLWQELPSWQTIQTSKEDWTLNGMPIKDESQDSVLSNILLWIKNYDLTPHVLLNHAVTNTKYENNVWQVYTQNQAFQAKHLVVASGAHNQPFFPKLRREDVKLKEYHSYYFKNPNELKGQKVTIVGGGASAFDLIDLAFQYEAKEVHWVYRSVKWFWPTVRLNYQRDADMRSIGMLQVLGVSKRAISRLVFWMTKRRYRQFGLQKIMPAEPLDYAQHQCVPGRPRMVKHFSKIKRHPSAIQGIKGNIVSTEKDHFKTDILLFGTGYELDLNYLGLEKLKHIKKPEELAKRCGHLFFSLDYPQLYFLGTPYIEGNGSAPLFYSFLARSVIAHIQNKAFFPMQHLDVKILYLDTPRLLAKHDRENYAKFFWRIKFFFKLIGYFLNRKRSFYLK